jgi:hypothetical protein
MKPRATLLSLAIIVGLGLGFWLYGVGRTMCETVGFTTRASLFGLLLSVVLPRVFALSLFIAKNLWWREKVWPVTTLCIVFGVSLLVGSITSEFWILGDEKKFAAEVSRVSKDNLYSRPRAWPNQICSLVFMPGKGIHATD